VGRLEQIASGFTELRKSRKSQPVAEVFKQVICFFFDGTRLHLVYFAHLKQDAGHSVVMESKPHGSARHGLTKLRVDVMRSFSSYSFGSI